MKRLTLRVVFALFVVLAVILASTAVKIYPEGFFWIERANARMPVWVRGNISSGTFLVYIHGGPGSSGIAEALFEVSPGDGRFHDESPLHPLESDYAIVYWDQRNSGMSGGSADPNAARIEDFGKDLALVVQTLRERLPVRRVFLLGASWGHSVALSYLTLIETWKENQSGIDGYIVYKGNHEANAPFQASRPRILRHAEERVAANRDAAFWQPAIEFYGQRTSLTTPAEFMAHDEYATRAMGVTYPVSARAWASFKASIFTPLNGWKFYLNNRRLRRADEFWQWVATDRTLSGTAVRLSVPTLLIYGEHDLIAPPEVGKMIHDAIGTPETRKTLLLLPHSRHGAEGTDASLMQAAIRSFVVRSQARQ